MHEGTCSAGFVRSLLEYAVNRGADRATLMARAELVAEAFADMDARQLGLLEIALDVQRV